MQLQAQLIELFTSALSSLGLTDVPVPVAKSTRAGCGQYQFNGAMALAKRLGKPPRDIASEIVAALPSNSLIASTEIAGPGFINISLCMEAIASDLMRANQDSRLGIPTQTQETVVVDLSSPNLAKEMHVGHLRSTIIGDAVARTLTFFGHQVIRQNHMGDWGTQFGMLLAHLSDKLDANAVAQTELADLEEFYRAAKIRFDEEEGFAERAREYVVRLQSGEAECLTLWQLFIDVSIAHSQAVYDTLGVLLTRADIMGESAYNDDLATVVSELKAQGIAVEDQGAQVVFLPEMADKEGKPAVYIVQKSGGGYLYATTDLAAIRYRCGQLAAQRTLIFTDARQALHFKQTELVARKAGFMPADHHYQHCPFGMMLGADGKPFKTRTGGTVKLAELLDEAVERATELVKQKNPELDAQAQAEIGRVVGIAAVKYADLSKNRTTDYVFTWEQMLSFEGNTAPYLLYAYTRIQSILRKAGDKLNQANDIVLLADAELALGLKLAQYAEDLVPVTIDAAPHVLCTYLYELASQFMTFYEACPILKEDVSPDAQGSRLLLAQLTAKTLHHGLDLLGIPTLEKM